MALDEDFAEALEGPVIHPFVAVEIDHPYAMIRLVDGLGHLVIDGESFVGNDPEIGSLATISVSTEGVGDESPEAVVSINPVSRAVGVSLCVPTAQGATVRIMWGAVDPITGLVVGVPETVYLGTIDVPTLVAGQDVVGAVSFQCVSAFEAFFEANQGQRLSHAFQTSVFPGDLAMQYVVDVLLSMPWGKPGARPQLTRAR